MGQFDEMAKQTATEIGEMIKPIVGMMKELESEEARLGITFPSYDAREQQPLLKRWQEVERRRENA